MKPRTLGLFLLLLPGLGHAAGYRVDLIVFTDKYSSAEPAKAAPNLTGAIDANDTRALAAAGIQLLPAASSGLSGALAQLKSSGRYQPLQTLSWIQNNPRAERGPALRLNFADTPQLDGSIALLLGTYLHLEVDLAYETSGGATQILRERRKMKRDELHYLDSPKLGVLAKITKLK